jgi:hypothetical protein
MFMKRKMRIFIVGLLLSAGFILAAGDCGAAFNLLDDKLRVKGSIYQFMIYRTKISSGKTAADNEAQYRDTDWGLMRTKGTLELLYKAVERENLQVNLFSFLQYWHESVPDFDQEYSDSMTTANRRRYQGPSYDQDDWINEMYADIYSGKWNIRLGKQIIFWSEVEMVRTVDRINPLDLRYTTPGIDPWDEMKLGLWMMRGFYNSDLPGQLVFEWIWIPGDFEGVRTPREGTSMGGPPGPQGPKDGRPLAFGQNAAVNEMWRKSQPAFTLSNSQFAFRIRGNSEVAFLGDYLLDWTLSYFHGMNNTPVPKSGEIATINRYQTDLALARVPLDFGNNPLFGLSSGEWEDMVPSGLWEYKFFDVIGTSCQTYVPIIGSVVRGEVSYEIGLPEIKADPDEVAPSYSKTITGTTERDVVNVGVTIDKPLKSTWLSQRWGASGVFDCTLGWFSQWRLGNVSRIRRTFAYQDRSQTNFTLTLRTRLKHNSIWPTVRALYNTRNFGYGVFAVRYTPGKHMRYELGYLWFFAHDKYQFRTAYAENKDSIYFRIGYEF